MEPSEDTDITSKSDSKTPKGRRTIIARQDISGDIVKSAARVLQILEFFDDIQREANVVEISSELGYPQSSTSVLLRSLVRLGYLNYSPQKRTYISSIRVALLGSWVNSLCLREGTIIESMRELNERTGDTIVLAARNGLFAQYIHVIQATSPARLQIGIGTVRPIATSATGHAILSMMNDDEVSRLVRRINAESGEENGMIDVKNLLATLSEIKSLGYAFGANLVTPGGAMLIAPLPSVSGPTQLFLGVAGIAQIMGDRKEALATHLFETVVKHFGASPKILYK